MLVPCSLSGFVRLYFEKRIGCPASIAAPIWLLISSAVMPTPSVSIGASVVAAAAALPAPGAASNDLSRSSKAFTSALIVSSCSLRELSTLALAVVADVSASSARVVSAACGVLLSSPANFSAS